MSEPVILTLDQIKQRIDETTLLTDIERGFAWYSEGRTVVPPVGYLAFDPPAAGDVHIKYGYVQGDEYFVVKIASGFAGNLARGLPVTNGLMLLFRQDIGEPAAILLDEGYLTEVRTAVAGAIAARHLARHPVARIGIVGTGGQARFQLRMLPQVTACREVTVWGRSDERLAAFEQEMAQEGFHVETTRDVRHLAATCDLIVTTTSAREPLLRLEDVRPGTHITAMGADAPGKQELDPHLVARADLVVADSVSQCVDHGELAGAVQAGLLDPARIVELGKLLATPDRPPRGADDITIADLTGVAVQDLQIATHVLRGPISRSPGGGG
ncbi:MAG TPA: ornithine cyclodeaminase family protein [Acidobacteria bacterium]|nr:ornithine cyclodeaminase family protein [Acidobacteriota bacterium]